MRRRRSTRTGGTPCSPSAGARRRRSTRGRSPRPPCARPRRHRALEDLLGSGAVLSALSALGPHEPTPEARAAATLWEATEAPASVLRRCDSGRELYEYGYPQDVAVAAEVDTSETVPVLTDGAFLEAP
ncbi:2-phosphosulfolactate phosphatase [Streptomyces sp. NPDC002992]|uniref:2-phosphosulfolactate phosphatase n=1 Tax=Streptomyces sp. NPDC002992 TaxID=3154273 RepID=UPI0033AB56EC